MNQSAIIMEDDVEAMIDDCMKRESKLSSWELSFIQSISDRYDSKGCLSEKQLETLDKIWERIT